MFVITTIYALFSIANFVYILDSWCNAYAIKLWVYVLFGSYISRYGDACALVLNMYYEGLYMYILILLFIFIYNNINMIFCNCNIILSYIVFYCYAYSTLYTLKHDDKIQ